MPRYLVAAIVTQLWPMILLGCFGHGAKLLGPSTCYIHTRPPVLSSSLETTVFAHVAGEVLKHVPPRDGHSSFLFFLEICGVAYGQAGSWRTWSLVPLFGLSQTNCGFLEARCSR